VGNQSNLILDPDLDSYYTMSLVILRFPELLEVINSTRDLALQLATAEGVRRQRLQTQFLILEGRMDATMGGIRSDYTEAVAASTPLLRQHLDGSRAALQQAVAQFRTSTQALAGAQAARRRRNCCGTTRQPSQPCSMPGARRKASCSA
jgi:hypothetical protein